MVVKLHAHQPGMTFRGRSRAIWLAAAGAAWLAGAGCATLHQPAPAAPAPPAESITLNETGTVLAMARQVGWQEVVDLLPALDEESQQDFPGVAALTREIHAVAATTQADRGMPAFDVGRLVDHNPDFWRAYYEIAPGDPLMAMLHAGLLLAAGEAARADAVATLAINFGRMNLEYRKELVRLDAYVQLLLQGSRDRAGNQEGRQNSTAFAALAAQAQARLTVWPQNPAALADLTGAQWGMAGKPRGISADSPAGATLAALRRTDPFFAMDPRVVGPEPAGWRRPAVCGC